MSMNKDPESERNLTSFMDDTVRPTEVKTIKVKKGIWRTYDATDGLPGQPNRLLQDRQGYLWIGTSAGLCRYDGMEFITYTTSDGLAGNWVNALCEDHEERLWISTTQGLSCCDGKEFTNYTAADGLPDNSTGDLCVDNQARLWIGTPEGLSRFDGKKFINYTTADGLIDNNVVSLCPSIQGGIWVGTSSGISRFDGEQFVTLTTEIRPERGTAVCADRHGRLWIGSGYEAKAGVYCFDGHQFANYTHEDGLVEIQNIVLSICEDRYGRMWFGAWMGVSCFDGSSFTNYDAVDGLAGGTFDMIEDREGQMWFAHGQLCSLSCYDAETVSLLTDKPVGWTCAQDNKGRVWSGGIHVTGIRHDSHASEVEQRKMSFTMGGIFLMVDSRDQLWISPVQDGVYCYDSSDSAWEAAGGDESSRPRHFGVSDNLADKTYIIPLLEMEDGTIWFSFLAAARLSRFDPDQLPDGKPLESIDTKGRVTCLIKDKLGRLWMVGRFHTGLSCWDGSELITYTEADGLSSNRIVSIVEDDSGGIWIGTEHGLCCFDGKRFITYGEEYGLRELFHWQSIKDASGQLWFATRGGIYRTDGEHFQWLTEEDGLPNNNVSGVFPQPDGSAIIWTKYGAVRYQPTATIPPPVEIREVVADKVYQNPTELNLTTTAVNLLTISYHGLSLVTKRMRYSYILEGYDKQWQETWERQARYESLPVGDYTFKVMAINRDLITSETPAMLKVKVVPDPRDVMVTELQSDLEVKNQQLTFLRREMEQKYRFEDIIGESETIRFVRAQMSQVIDKDVNVLITGETGTGKELVARGIHHNSSRKDKMYLPRNCGSIPKELAESILFGHRKGAFTDAKEDHMGLFEIASGGTVVLDEIGDMAINIQPVLLRVLQERKFQRVDEHIFRELDIRIISITNRDILEEIKAGRFRRDLYYRLNGFHIFVPSLRDRRDDIPLLAEHFYREACHKQRKELDGFVPEAMDMLYNHTWPGNVRELQTEIERACILAQRGSRIQTYHFSPQITHEESLAQEIISERLSYKESVKQFRRQLVERALQECDGNRTQAARMLDMGRSNLVHLIKDMELDE